MVCGRHGTGLALRLSMAAVTSLALMLVASAASAQQRRPAEPRIYGAELMSEEEISEYTAALEALTTPELRAAFRIDHREKLDARAREQGVTLGRGDRKSGGRRGEGRPGASAGAGARGGGQARRPTGWDLMSEDERGEYLETLRSLTTQDERTALRDEHRKKMEARAKEQGVELQPPDGGGRGGQGRRIYGQKVMSPEEIEAHNETLEGFKTLEERREFQQRHVAEMQRRAEEQGVKLPPPPGKQSRGAGQRQRARGAGGPPGVAAPRAPTE